MNRLTLTALIFTTIFAGTLMAATTNYVVTPGTPGVTPTASYTSWATAATNIQDAIDVVGSGGLVLVTNGTYVLTDMITVDDNITLRSFNNGAKDLDGTIIDAQYPAQSNRCLYVNNASALIDGFTLTNGCPLATSLSGVGGGLYLQAGRVQNCRIVGNRSAGNGGGVYLTGASTLLADSLVSGNQTGKSNEGGGVYIYWTGQITNCIIANNRAKLGGGVATKTGATFFFLGSPSMLDCVISNNVANVLVGETGAGFGGGIYSTNFQLVDGCIVTHNLVDGISGSTYGAGIMLGNGGIVRDSTIAYNTGGNYGGGIAVGGALNMVTNSLIHDNNGGHGGGFYTSGGLVVNCTVVSNNTAAFVQGGTIRNCLIANNTSGIRDFSGVGGVYQNCTITGNGYGLDIGYLQYYSVTSIVENCILYDNGSSGINYTMGSAAGIVLTNTCTLPQASGLYDTGNITDSPMFVDASSGNYRLRKSSPCINTGIVRPWMTGAVDLDGFDRINSRYHTVDMGAYEYQLPLQGPTVFIK